MPDTIEFQQELTISTQVADLDAAIAWYGQMLGCELLYRVEDLGWAEITSPVSTVRIGLSQVETPKTAGPVPVWSVADIAKARAVLEAKGVRFDGDTVVIPDMVSLATFFDPDGNAWMLAESHGAG
jgi:catechol 2,3-dioxygenase-like lactoylglutathione lyase family enzyme